MKRAFVGFAGFGLVDIALKQAGFDVVGVELIDEIAEVNRANGGNCLTADLLGIIPPAEGSYDLMHFSPPCPSFSPARSKKSKQNIYQRISDLARFQVLLNSEGEIDLQLSRKICRFIRVCKPPYFTLENVWAYRNALSFANIWYALLEGGYSVGWWHLNAADYGDPQSRRRMVLIARRDGGTPQKPWPTHSKNGDMFTGPWTGWFEAIEDLIPGLPASQFAPWQEDGMPDELKTFLMMTGNTSRNGIDNKSGRGILDKDRPANTVTAGLEGVPRTFLLGQGKRSKPKDKALPADTVTSNGNQTGVKAFIVGQNYGSPNTTNGQRKLSIRDMTDPIFTIEAQSNRLNTRACLQSGHVVSMTPRCLARFQSFPDWFELPDNRALAVRGIGNAMPLGLGRAMIKETIR